jgi:hypothetical protein
MSESLPRRPAPSGDRLNLGELPECDVAVPEMRHCRPDTAQVGRAR